MRALWASGRLCIYHRRPPRPEGSRIPLCQTTELGVGYVTGLSDSRFSRGSLERVAGQATCNGNARGQGFGASQIWQTNDPALDPEHHTSLGAARGMQRPSGCDFRYDANRNSTWLRTPSRPTKLGRNFDFRVFAFWRIVVEKDAPLANPNITVHQHFHRGSQRDR